MVSPPSVTEMLVDGVDPKFTAVAPVKPLPEIATSVSGVTVAALGLTPVTTGTPAAIGAMLMVTVCSATPRFASTAPMVTR